ncbi:MAG TPA: 50S ribosomal protein L25 [Chloroflexi bacterium]|nr:50S ribosomal protein L25 [Chloroflexota bacterium]
MAQTELNVEMRTVLGKQVRRLRREGWVPAVLYGRGLESRALQIRRSEAEDVVAEAGTSHLITIRVAGEEKPVQAVVRDLQRDPVRRNLLHLDLYQVEMTTSLTVEVPITLVGESPVVELREGILLQGLQTVEIECLPGDLIDAIEVDLSILTEVDQQITVADLAVPSSVHILSDPDEMVVRVSPLEAPVEEEEEIEEIPEAEPEVVGRHRAEEKEAEKEET